MTRLLVLVLLASSSFQRIGWFVTLAVGLNGSRLKLCARGNPKRQLAAASGGNGVSTGFEEIAQLARFDGHWRVTLAGDNRLLAQALALAKRGYLDVLKRRVPLYRLSDLGRQAIAVAGKG